jgi:anti-anti-sigma factor
MEMNLAPVAAGIVNVELVGRLDTPGVDAIETRLTESLVPAGASAIIDLSRVEFVGSMAIRMFMTIARGLAKKQCRLVLYAPQPLVAQVFETVSLGDIIPLAPDSGGALELAGG